MSYVKDLPTVPEFEAAIVARKNRVPDGIYEHAFDRLSPQFRLLAEYGLLQQRNVRKAGVIERYAERTDYDYGWVSLGFTSFQLRSFLADLLRLEDALDADSEPSGLATSLALEILFELGLNFA